MRGGRGIKGGFLPLNSLMRTNHHRGSVCDIRDKTDSGEETLGGTKRSGYPGVGAIALVGRLPQKRWVPGMSTGVARQSGQSVGS